MQVNLKPADLRLIIESLEPLQDSNPRATDLIARFEAEIWLDRQKRERAYAYTRKWKEARKLTPR